MRSFLLVLPVLLVCCVPAFALSDADYLAMKQSSKAFRQADTSMAESYTSCKNVLPKSDFEKIREEQREWISSGRDARAKEIREDTGCSQLEAYVQATQERGRKLYHYIHLSDAAYQAWKTTSKEFREADQSMAESYTSCKNVLPKSDFEKVRKEQRAWIASGRDKRANSIRKDEDCSRLEAYIQATQERDRELYHYIQMYELWYTQKYGDLPPSMKE